MINHLNYERTLNLGDEESLSKIVKKIPNNSVVLDIGCGPGTLGSYLVSEKQCIVDGVDYDAQAIAKCSDKYRKTAVRNLESDYLVGYFEPESYDIIVVADVIEHLVNPDILLNELKKLVKKNGSIIFSVPNVTHLALGFELLFGKFKYRNNGLLDNTHLRFYSKESLIDKLESAGLNISELDSVQKQMDETEFPNFFPIFFPVHWVKKLILQRDDSLTYQWVVSTKLGVTATVDVSQYEKSVAQSKFNPTFMSELFWVNDESSGHSLENRLVGHIGLETEDFTIVDFNFSEAGFASSFQNIRIDPISDQKSFMIVGAEILNAEKKVIWTWTPHLAMQQMVEAKYVKSFGPAGILFQAISDDPKWFPEIDKDILNALSINSTFRLYLKTGESLNTFYNNEFIDPTLNMEKVIADTQNIVMAMHNSTSWKITRPLRLASRIAKKSAQTYQLFNRYRKIYPGIKGLLRIFTLARFLLWKGGIKGLLSKINTFTGVQKPISELNYIDNHEVLFLKDIDLPEGTLLPSDIAVHAHIFYTELAAEMGTYLKNIPTKYALYITTDSEEKASIIKKAFVHLKNVKTLEVQVTENRGRDIFPFVAALGSKLIKHEIVLHIHSKRSPHESLILSGWRRYLMESLLGNPRRVLSILQQFEKDKNLGLLFPNYFQSAKQFIYKKDSFNENNIKKMLLRADKNKDDINKIDMNFFPAGDMFWLRGKVIEPFVKMNLSAKDFEPEMGQVNLTIAHAIERMFPYFANEANLQTKAFLAETFLSANNSAHRFDLFHSYLKEGVIKSPTIFFDHNGGGGTNLYTTEVLKSISVAGGSSLRIYFSNGFWFIQWYGNNDGLFFYTSSDDELFLALELTAGRDVIVNSLYGVSDVQDVVNRIIHLKHVLKAKLDIKMHDFYALCSSPHLSDYTGKYCGVPQDFNVCKKCLKESRGWYHSWYPKDKIPTTITQWRKPFSDLFEVADKIDFFDPSSVEIAHKAFAISDEKINVAPHAVHYVTKDKPMKTAGVPSIGVLGTMSQTKGSDIIADLNTYLEKQGGLAPITVVGASVVPVPEGIHMHGAYEQVDLVKIMNLYGINVILMPSIVPETFSYTISEAMEMRLPIVAFDIGAQGRRVRNYELGKVIPLNSSPEIIFSAIKEILKKAQESKK
ncbi:MAG: rhamnan synthesis F family protein [Pseudobdellovibrio sp.]